MLTATWSGCDCPTDAVLTLDRRAALTEPPVVFSPNLLVSGPPPKAPNNPLPELGNELEPKAPNEPPEALDSGPVPESEEPARAAEKLVELVPNVEVEGTPHADTRGALTIGVGVVWFDVLSVSV